MKNLFLSPQLFAYQGPAPLDGLARRPGGGSRGARQRWMIGRTSRLGAQDAVAVGGVGPAGALTTSKGFDPYCGRSSENCVHAKFGESPTGDRQAL